MTNKLLPMMVLILILAFASASYAWQGVMMHKQVAVEEAAFHSLQAEYWSLAKSERDAAATGSELNDDLVKIKNYPSELLRLKLVGIGRILTGIFILLFAILLALIMMPARLSAMKKK